MKTNIIKKEVFVFLIIVGISFASALIWSDEESNPFSYGGSIVCTVDSTTARWNDGANSVNAITDCYRAGGINSAGTQQTTCCPSGYVCGGTTENPASSCVASERNIVSCNTFTESECNDYYGDSLPQGIREHIENDIVTINSGGLNFCDPDSDSSEHIIGAEQCDYYDICRCEWRNGKCEEKFDIIDVCSEPPEPTAVCRTTTHNIVDRCSTDNVFVLNWTSRLVDINNVPVIGTQTQREGCVSGQKTFPCPESSNLGFFGFWNLIISALLIGVVYLFLRKE